MQAAGQVGSAQTVQVRVQVVDMESFALDIVVPTYIPTKDLSQRIARDAGLQAYWEDGRRRNYWIRARGRLLGPEEKLQDLGVVQYELIHILPEPPANAQVQEQVPDYPEGKGYAGKGRLAVLGSLMLVAGWTGLWSQALLYSRQPVVGILPAVGLSLFCVSLARHLRSGSAQSVLVPVIGLVIFVPFVALAAVPTIVWGEVSTQDAVLAVAPGLLGGFIGVVLGWLAWYGAVEPLPERKVVVETQGQGQAQQHACGICGLPVGVDVQAPCKFACGKVFHSGCYKARQSVFQGAGCSVCGYNPAGA